MNPTPLLPISANISPQGCLSIGNHDLELLAKQYGTPLYLYDAATIRHQVETLRGLLKQAYPGECLVAYAAKAYFSEGFSRKLAALSLGVDVVSLGELELARRGGFSPGAIHLHGNNKSEAELSAALEIKAQAIVVDSLDELYFLETLAARHNQRARIWLRVTPTVQGHTHAHIDTSGTNSKFGLHIANGQAAAAIRYAQASAWLDLVGLHTHLGSQLFEPGTYRQAIHQHHVAADAKGGCGEGNLDCIARGRGPRHQRGAGQHSGLIQFNDGPVDPGGQSKVVGIENEAAHRLSVSIRAVPLPGLSLREKRR